MLVLIGPPFQGNDAEYGRLAELTGILPYELRTKLKPGAWGVVRALADRGQAEALRERLWADGFRSAVVDPHVASDPGRMFVPLRAIELAETEVVLHLSERTMPIAHRALLTIVRGEVQVGARPRTRPGSSSSFRAVVPNADLEVFREPSAKELDAFAAADLHFATVLWAARIDVRSFDFSVLGQARGGVNDLDRLVDFLGERTGLRVDRGSRVSSVASFSAGAGAPRSATPVPGQSAPPRREAPERFDGYSRLVAEAERQLARLTRASTRPPAPA